MSAPPRPCSSPMRASGASPARAPSTSASASTPRIPATATWLHALATCPAPLAPQWASVPPRTSRTGRARARSSAAPPTMIASVPAAAPAAPPLTGRVDLAASPAARPHPAPRRLRRPRAARRGGDERRADSPPAGGCGPSAGPRSPSLSRPRPPQRRRREDRARPPADQQRRCAAAAVPPAALPSYTSVVRSTMRARRPGRAFDRLHVEAGGWRAPSGSMVTTSARLSARIARGGARGPQRRRSPRRRGQVVQRARPGRARPVRAVVAGTASG